MREWLVLIHILAAMVWIGGGIYAMFQSHRALTTGEGLGIVISQEERAGRLLFGPAAAVVLITGLANVMSTPAWSFGQTFVWLSLTLVLVSGLIGGAFYGPVWKRMQSIHDDNPDDPTLTTLRRRVSLISRLDLVILLTVVVLMVTKPI
jgi:uncharacterized membrane protein